MKRIATLLGIAALAAGSAVADNHINGPLCIDFVNFCDGIQLSPGGGQWVNNDCAGATAPVVAQVNGSVISVLCNGDACPIGLTWMFKFDRLSGTFDMYGSDGVNPPFVQQRNSPYRIGRGTCNFSEKIGLPAAGAR